jgi:hypothetical protein
MTAGEAEEGATPTIDRGDPAKLRCGWFCGEMLRKSPISDRQGDRPMCIGVQGVAPISRLG